MRAVRFFRGELVEALLPLPAAEVEEAFSEIDALRREAADIGAAIVKVLPAFDEATFDKTIDDARRAGEGCSELTCDCAHTAITVAAKGKEGAKLRHCQFDGEPVIGDGRPEQAKDDLKVSDEALCACRT